MKNVIIFILAIALLGLGFMSSQAAVTSAQASLAQGIAQVETSGAVVQAQCLAGIVGVLGLTAGIPIGIFLYARYQRMQQQKIALAQAQMRAMQQPRRSNGRWWQQPRSSQLMIPPQYMQMPQGQPFLVMMPPPQYPYQQALQQPQQFIDPQYILEMDDEDDGADVLQQWGF